MESYLTKTAQNSKTVNVFILKYDNEIVLRGTDYGDRSYETFQKKVKEGKIKVPSNVNIIPLDPMTGKKGNLHPADIAQYDHAPAIDSGSKMFNQVWNKYIQKTKIK